MKDAKMGILLVAGIPQGGGHCSASSCEHGSPKEGQQLLPGRGGKYRAKRFQQGYNGGSAWHESSPGHDRRLATAIVLRKVPCRVCYLQICIKSSSGALQERATVLTLL